MVAASSAAAAAAAAAAAGRVMGAASCVRACRLHEPPQEIDILRVQCFGRSERLLVGEKIQGIAKLALYLKTACR